VAKAGALACAVTAFSATRACTNQSARSPGAFVPAGRVRAADLQQTLGPIAVTAPASTGGGRSQVVAGAAVLGAVALAASKPAALSRPTHAVSRRRAGEQRPREGKRVGDAIWFDLTLSLPLGLGLTLSPRDGGVFVDEVREGGSAFEHNQKHTVSEANFGRKHFIQEGDQLLMVNGQRCSSVDEAVAQLTSAEDPENLQMKFVRKLGGNVKLIFPESGTEIAAPGQVPMQKAAKAAGHEVVYACTDGTCGTCWHKDEKSGEVYLLCQEDCKVGLIPSLSMFTEESIFFDLDDYKSRQGVNPNFENTEPLVLRTCPEVYEEWKETDKAQSVMADLRAKRFNIFE